MGRAAPPLSLASMRLPSPSETDRQQRPRKKPSGGSSLHGWGDSRAEGREAATANGNGTASQRPLSLRRGASTYNRTTKGVSSRLFCKKRIGNQQPKPSHFNISGKSVYLSGKSVYLSGKSVYLSGKSVYLSGKSDIAQNAIY